MAEYLPVSGDDPEPFSLTAGGTITGGTLVMSNAGSNDQVVACDATHHPVGVAGHDAVSGQRLTIYPLVGVVHEVAVTGTVVLAAGDTVKVAAAGAIDKGTLATDSAAGTFIGVCVRGATGPAKARFLGA
jgi:hypothetical protein